MPSSGFCLNAELLNNNSKKIQDSVDDSIESNASHESKGKFQSLKMYDKEKWWLVDAIYLSILRGKDRLVVKEV